MAAMSDFLENKIIDFLFRAQALGVTSSTAAAGTGPATVFFALLTAAPTDVGGGTEVTGGSYARVAVTASLLNFAGTQAAASTVVSSGTSGTTSNNTALAFPTPSAAWGSITSFGIYDAASGGNLLFYGNLTSAKTVNNGDPAPTFPISAFALQIDN